VKIIVEVFGCIRKGGKDDDLAVLPSVAVRGRMRELLRKEFFEFNEFTVAQGRDILCLQVELVQLPFVLLKSSQEHIHLHVSELEGLLLPEAELGGLFKEIILLIFDRLLVHCLESRPCNILEFLKRIFQLINTVNSAFHRIFKRTNRTLEPLEEVCLHHADQEVFAVGLFEGADPA